MKATRIALAAALLLSSEAALAQTAGDAGCIIVSNAFAQSATDPEAKKLAEASLYFYLGRIGDHATAAQLKVLLNQQAKTLTDATAGNVMTACIKALQDKVQLVQSLSPQAKPPQSKPQGR